MGIQVGRLEVVAMAVQAVIQEALVAKEAAKVTVVAKSAEATVAAEAEEESRVEEGQLAARAVGEHRHSIRGKCTQDCCSIRSRGCLGH